MIDYSKGKNIAHNIITDKIRVSTAKFQCYYGFLCETWIFSNDSKQKSRQIWHDLSDEEMCIKIHNYIVNNLKERYVK